MTEESSARNFRRQPVQARSQRRVEMILDAAAQLVIRYGYEGMTTDRIAARAGIPVGSIYQFFRNKHAILEELRHRYEMGLHEAVVEAMNLDDLDEPWEIQIERLIDAIANYNLAVPAYNRIVQGIQASGGLRGAHESRSSEDVLNLLVVWTERRAPHLDEAERLLVARVTFEAGRSLFELARRDREGYDVDVLAHMKALIKGYLQVGPAQLAPSRNLDRAAAQ